MVFEGSRRASRRVTSSSATLDKLDKSGRTENIRRSDAALCETAVNVQVVETLGDIFRLTTIVLSLKTSLQAARDLSYLQDFVHLFPLQHCMVHAGPGVGVETRLWSKVDRGFFLFFCRGTTIGRPP